MINNLSVLVTGSARLDVYRKAGDSLLGRHEFLHLLPLSVGETASDSLRPPPEDWLHLEGRNLSTAWKDLEKYTCFPEPFLKQEGNFANRWSRRRHELLLNEDIRDLSEVKNLSQVEHLALLLPDRVGSLLWLNALREEIGIAHDTVSNWIQILDRLYYCFRLRPYTEKFSRSLKKETKLYLWDWTVIQNEDARFENMVAYHLYKKVDTRTKNARVIYAGKYLAALN